MNFHNLYRKYVNADATLIVHDRTYDGLEVVDGVKPTLPQFEAFQREEDRQYRSSVDVPKAKERSLLQEKQHQARVKALEDIRPFEDKIREEEMAIRHEIFSIRVKAIELQERQKTVEAMNEAWYELTAAQEKINEEARAYLSDTDWYFTRETETKIKVPEEVVRLRQEARDRIQKGELVHAHWQRLRNAEMPSREEIRKAIKAGGEELERIRELCQSAVSKYKRPKRKIY